MESEINDEARHGEDCDVWRVKVHGSIDFKILGELVYGEST